jgi:hypothetical protein
MGYQDASLEIVRWNKRMDMPSYLFPHKPLKIYCSKKVKIVLESFQV